MTTTTERIEDVEDLEQTPVKQHPYRWRLNRAGITNVWF